MKAIKTVGKILGKILLGALLIVYIAVAVANYSLVQSVAGSIASHKLSEATGGIVSIGSLSINLFDHVVVHDAVLVDPLGDTVSRVRRTVVKFREFPYADNQLHVSRLFIRDGYFYLDSYPGDSLHAAHCNINYLTDIFHAVDKHPNKKFTMIVDRAYGRNLHYKQRLNPVRDSNYSPSVPNGVDVQNMEFDNINFKISNVRIAKGDVTCRIDRFDARERSGFQLDKLQSNVYVASNGISLTNLDLESEGSALRGDMMLRYTSWHSMADFLDSVYMFADFEPGSQVCLQTAAYWTDVLWGLDDTLTLVGTAYGTVSDLHADNLLLRFGHASELQVDAVITGLPRIGQTHFDITIPHLSTNHTDITTLNILKHFDVNLPSWLSRLGAVDIALDLNGSANNLTAHANVNTAVGTVSAHGWVLQEGVDKEYVYYAQSQSSNLTLGRLLPNEWLHNTGFNLMVQGVGFDPKTMDASLDIALFNTQLKGSRLKTTRCNASIEDGLLTTTVSIAEPIADLDLRAQLDLNNSDSLRCKVDASVRQIDLYHLGLLHGEHDSVARIATQLIANAEWPATLKSIDQMRGHVTLQQTNLQHNDELLRVNNIDIDIDDDMGAKNIDLTSDMVDANIRGYFTYADLSPMVRDFCNSYLPTYYNPYHKKQQTNDELRPMALRCNLQWHDTRNQLAFFLPKVHIANGTTLNGNYSSLESLKLVLRSDSIRFGNVTLDNIGMDCRDIGGLYTIKMDVDRLLLGVDSLVDDVNVTLSADNRSLQCDLKFGNPQDTSGTSADISALMRSDTSGNSITLLRNAISLRGELWELRNAGGFIFSNDGIELHGLELCSKDLSQSIMATAHIKKQPDDELKVFFRAFDISQLNFLLSQSGINIGGVLNGRFAMYGFDDTPYFNATIDVTDMDLNQIALGNTSVKSSWNAELNQLNLFLNTALRTGNGTSSPIQVNGYIDMKQTDKILDFDVSLDDIWVGAVAPFTQGILSDIDGHLSGDITVGGSLRNPLLIGEAYLNNCKAKVDMLGTAFSLDDSILFDSTAIILNNFTLHDSKQGFMDLNGRINHHGLKNMNFDIDVTVNNLLCMNTQATKGAAYYGTALLSADGHVHGPAENLDIMLNAKTNSGTNIHIPINDKKTVKTANYITFVSANDALFSFENNPTLTTEDTTTITQTQRRHDESSRFNYRLQINFDATPDAKLYIPIDLSQIDVNMAVTGSGLLQVSLSSSSSINILGDYVIDDGAVDLSLLGLVSRKFSISEGSVISFPGPINAANLDVEAVYSQRVNTATLTGESSAESSGQNITVQNVIGLSGPLTGPQLAFDIRMPNVDQSVQDEVFSYIDRNNETDMLNQTVSLLVFNKFYSSTSSTNVTNDGLSSGYSLLVNTLGSLVSDAVNFVDVSFDYKAASELSGQQIGVDISKSWNKLYFESTLGFSDDNDNLSGTTNNAITGDVLLGYRVNPRIHLYVFNRSNTNDYTRSDLPYKQGLGIKYVREFNCFGDLFRRQTQRKDSIQ